MPEEQVAFGKELRRMRKEMKMTQEKLAEKVDCSPSDISRYEQGHREMGAILYSKILRLYQETRESQADQFLRQIQKLDVEKRKAILKMIELM